MCVNLNEHIPAYSLLFFYIYIKYNTTPKTVPKAAIMYYYIIYIHYYYTYTHTYTTSSSMLSIIDVLSYIMSYYTYLVLIGKAIQYLHINMIQPPE